MASSLHEAGGRRVDVVSLPDSSHRRTSGDDLGDLATPRNNDSSINVQQPRVFFCIPSCSSAAISVPQQDKLEVV